jgi:hypothetical protein
MKKKVTSQKFSEVWCRLMLKNCNNEWRREEKMEFSIFWNFERKQNIAADATVNICT